MAWSRGASTITYEFAAEHTGKYFFGVRKAWTTSKGVEPYAHTSTSR